MPGSYPFIPTFCYFECNLSVTPRKGNASISYDRETCSIKVIVLPARYWRATEARGNRRSVLTTYRRHLYGRLLRVPA